MQKATFGWLFCIIFNPYLHLYHQYVPMQQYARLVVLSLFCLCACKHRHKQDMSGFPLVTALDSTLNTQFVPTMQDTLAKGKNVIYTPAFLFAWKELRGVFKDEMKTTWKNPYLQLIDHSTTYKGSLNDDEYSTTVTHNGATVDIIASFAKSLSFTQVMDTSRVKFDEDETVKAFGMPEFNEKIAAQIQILYYRDDEHFIIRITPKEQDQTITIAMGAGDGFTFEEVLKDIKHYILMGADEFKHPAYEWKGEWRGNDELLIPIIGFNYQASYSSILDEPVDRKGNNVIKKATQQTAFLIDEQGAKVESKAEILVAAAAPPSDPDAKPHVKKLYCNKPFFIMLSKKTSDYPYFMMKVCNTDFMLKR